MGIDLHKGSHRARCLDERAQVCDAVHVPNNTRRVGQAGRAHFPGQFQPYRGLRTYRAVVANGSGLFTVDLRFIRGGTLT